MSYHRVLSRVACLLLLMAWTTLAGAQRPRVGVVLSGGGAKGIAHIGVLRVLEEAGIPVDYIVGTSMGAIVGGLSAIGYSASALDSIVRKQDWPFLLSDKIYRLDLSPGERAEEERYLLTLPFDRINARERRPVGFVSGHNILNIFTELTIGYHDSTDFSRFPVPFRCVAVDVKRRREVILSGGNLALAMRASMAIPGFFTPVAMDSMLLVDGGMMNNFPVDVAREMGADIIIGVDVHADVAVTDDLTSMSNTLPRLINLLCMNKYKENARMVDLLIHPNLQEFSAADFHARAVDSLLVRGERAAREQWDSLVLLKMKHGLDRKDDEPRRPGALARPSRFPVREITLEGLTPQQERWLRRKILVKAGSELSIEEIHRTINMLYNTRAFSSVNYRLTGGPAYTLVLSFTPHPMNYINIGARFDSEEMGAILFNTTISNRIVRGAQLSLTARLSRYPYLRAELSLENTLLRRFNLAGEVRFNDVDIYARGKKRSNVTYRYYLGELSISNLYFRDGHFHAGARYELFDYNAFLFADGDATEKVHPESFISYFGKVHVETLDKGYFPDRGFSIEAELAYHTDNAVTYKKGAPFSSIAVHLKKVIPLSSPMKALLAFHGRTLVGRGPAYSFYNHVGGVVPGRHNPRQLPFWGIQRLEVFDNSLWIGQVQLRHQLSRSYLSIVCNAAQQDDDFSSMFSRKIVWGGGVAYSRNSRIGPVEAILSLSNWTKSPNFYFNWGFYF